MQVNKLSSNNLLEQVRDIRDGNNPSLVVLTSMDIEVRNRWIRAFKTPYRWAHSMRVIRHIENRLNIGECSSERITIDSVYNVIYGGADTEDEDSQSNELNDNNSEETDDGAQVIIPVKRSILLDENSTVVFCEAQLLSQNLNQTELIRYGSGRLLDDVLSFVFEKGNRKLILIGDPYYLTYGKSTDSSLHIETLVEKLPNIPIYCYEDGISEDSCPGKQELRTLLASSIERQCFNSLHYDFSFDLENIKRESLEPILIDWFSQPLSHDPQNAALFYTKNDCYLTNMWIKKHCLKNGEDLAIGDLLIMNNNITISADLPIEDPIKIYNGMYLTLLGIIGHDDKTIPIRTKGGIINVSLNFTKMKVKCLSIERTPEKDIFMLDNYFKADELTKNEQIALRVYCNELIREKIREKELSFTGSSQYQNMVDSDEFKDLSPDEKRAIYDLANNVGIKKGQQKEVHTTNNVRKIFRRYRHKWEMNIRKQILDTDPYLNSAWLSYGWAITVHKSLGVYFNSIWFKGSQNANSGYSNDNYYRWLYSGVTASNGTVYLSSPQIISPLMNCQIENVEENKDYTGGLYIVFSDDYIKYHKSIDIHNIHIHTNIMLDRISTKMEEMGYVLQSVVKKSPYLTMATYEKVPHGTLRVLIDNKGEKDNYAISNIRLESGIGEEFDMIRHAILQCECMEWPNDIRGEIYDFWKGELKKCNIKMCIIKIQDWHDTIMLFDISNRKVYLEIWYNGDGFITKIKVLSIECPEVYNQFVDIALKHNANTNE